MCSTLSRLTLSCNANNALQHDNLTKAAMLAFPQASRQSRKPSTYQAARLSLRALRIPPVGLKHIPNLKDTALEETCHFLTFNAKNHHRTQHAGAAHIQPSKLVKRKNDAKTELFRATASCGMSRSNIGNNHKI